MHTQDIPYDYDGVSLKGFLAYDETLTSRRPGILVAHDAGGLADHTREKCRRLAALGYVAFALDVYGSGPVEPEEATRRVQALSADFPRWRGLAKAGLDVLVAQPQVDPTRLAATGYCLGGVTILELARSGADLKGVVGFHPGLSIKSGDAKAIRGRVLILVGADDPYVTPDSRMEFEKEMREAGVDWRMVIYGGVLHSFTTPWMDGSRPGFKYDPRADAHAWDQMRGLFDEIFA